MVFSSNDLSPWSTHYTCIVASLAVTPFPSSVTSTVSFAFAYTVTGQSLFTKRAKHSPLINIISWGEGRRECFLQGSFDDFSLLLSTFSLCVYKEGLKYNFATDLESELTRKNGGEIGGRGKCPPQR